MGAEGKARTPQPDPPWHELPPTMKNSNRRSHRHAAMKLAALGYDWKQWNEGRLPVLSDSEKEKLHNAQDKLAHAGFELPTDEGDDTAVIRKRFLGVVKAEHDRWIIDRAIDGWRYGPLRDNDCLLHPSMCNWSRMDRRTRAFDAVQVRTFIDRQGSRSSPMAQKRKVLRINLGQGSSVSADLPFTDWDQATEIQVLMPAGAPSADGSTPVKDARQQLIQALVTAFRILARAPKLCRVFLIFPAPPAPAVLGLANRLAKAVEAADVLATPVWAWRKGAGTGPRLPEGFQNCTHDETTALLTTSGRFRPEGVSRAADVWSNILREAEGLPSEGSDQGLSAG